MMTFSKILLALTALFFLMVDGFVPNHSTRRVSITLMPMIATGNDDESRFFTGGAFDKMEPEAVAIASRIRSVQDLGWTGKAKRRGSTSPRHRAFGGQNEKAVQEKPNYDESNPRCVEKWLTQQEFYIKVRDSSPAADTVFVALAGGGAYAEREIVEQKLAAWKTGGRFDEGSFLKTVQQGRLELGVGWLLFATLVGSAALIIIFPTNPLAKALEQAIAPFTLQKTVTPM